MGASKLMILSLGQEASSLTDGVMSTSTNGEVMGGGNFARGSSPIRLLTSAATHGKAGICPSPTTSLEGLVCVWPNSLTRPNHETASLTFNNLNVVAWFHPRGRGEAAGTSSSGTSGPSGTTRATATTCHTSTPGSDSHTSSSRRPRDLGRNKRGADGSAEWSRN